MAWPSGFMSGAIPDRASTQHTESEQHIMSTDKTLAELAASPAPASSPAPATEGKAPTVRDIVRQEVDRIIGAMPGGKANLTRLYTAGKLDGLAEAARIEQAEADRNAMLTAPLWLSLVGGKVEHVQTFVPGISSYEQDGLASACRDAQRLSEGAKGDGKTRLVWHSLGLWAKTLEAYLNKGYALPAARRMATQEATYTAFAVDGGTNYAPDSAMSKMLPPKRLGTVAPKTIRERKAPLESLKERMAFHDMQVQRVRASAQLRHDVGGNVQEFLQSKRVADILEARNAWYMRNLSVAPVTVEDIIAGLSDEKVYLGIAPAAPATEEGK